MIKLEDVSYYYSGKEEEFSLKASFEVQSQEFVMILGESGCGKSTLIALLGGFLAPESGKIFIDDQDATRFMPHERDMAIIFQEHNLFAHLSIRDNLKLARKKPPIEKKEVEEVLERFHLTEFGDRSVSTLSGGQIQRAALSRCILQKKKILVLDEALSSLDPFLRETLLEEIHKIFIQEKLTVFFTTHSPLEGKKYASRVIFLKKGKVFYDGSVKGFFNSKKPEIEKYLTKVVSKDE